MFPVTITLHDAASLNAVLAALGTPTAAPAPVAATVKTEKPAATPKPTPQQESKPAAAEASAPAAPAASTASSSELELQYERDVKPLIIKLGAVKGRDQVLAVLGKFGATKGTELAAEQLAGAKAALEAALGA